MSPELRNQVVTLIRSDETLLGRMATVIPRLGSIKIASSRINIDNQVGPEYDIIEHFSNVLVSESEEVSEEGEDTDDEHEWEEEGEDSDQEQEQEREQGSGSEEGRSDEEEAAEEGQEKEGETEESGEGEEGEREFDVRRFLDIEARLKRKTPPTPKKTPSRRQRKK